MPLSSFIRLYYGNPLAELIYIFRTEPARGRRGRALSQSHRRGLRFFTRAINGLIPTAAYGSTI